MPTIYRRFAPTGLALGVVAVLLSLPQTLAWAQGGGGEGEYFSPGWIGLLFGALGTLLGGYGTWLMMRRDVAGLRRAVYGDTANEKDGLLRRVDNLEGHICNEGLHVPATRIVGVETCRIQRLDCAAARTEAMHALHEDFRRLEDKLDRLIERP